VEQGIAQLAVLVLYQGRVTASPGSSPGPDMVARTGHFYGVYFCEQPP
jgi:hypothetical protein